MKAQDRKMLNCHQIARELKLSNEVYSLVVNTLNIYLTPKLSNDILKSLQCSFEWLKNKTNKRGNL